MKRILLAMMLVCVAAMISYSCKQNQTQPETVSTTSEDSMVTVDEEPYNLEAIAKAIEGCTYLYRFEKGVAFMEKDDERVYIDLQGRRNRRKRLIPMH